MVQRGLLHYEMVIGFELVSAYRCLGSFGSWCLCTTTFLQSLRMRIAFVKAGPAQDKPDPQIFFGDGNFESQPSRSCFISELLVRIPTLLALRILESSKTCLGLLQRLAKIS